MLEFCCQQNIVPWYLLDLLKHPSPLYSSTALLEQPAPDPGIFSPQKHSQKLQNSLFILAQLEKAQLGTYCVKIIGLVKGVFTTR